MLILSSQDLFFSALRKHTLCNAHLLFPRPAGKRNKNKLLLPIPNTLLAPGHLVLGLPNAALTNHGTNEPAEKVRQNVLSVGWLWTYCSQLFRSEAVVLAHSEKDAQICALLVWQQRHRGRRVGAGAAAAAPAQQPRFHGTMLLGDPRAAAAATRHAEPATASFRAPRLVNPTSNRAIR